MSEFRRFRRARLALAACVSVVVITACGAVGAATGAATTGAGAGVTSTTPVSTTPDTTTPGTTPSGPPSSTCSGDETYADPSIAFESSLRSGDVLEVGRTGWLSTAAKASSVEITGDTDAVVLKDMSVGTYYKCGEVLSTASWVEVKAVAPGTVTLSWGSKSSSVELTVR